MLIKRATHKYLAMPLDMASTHLVLVIIIIFITAMNLEMKKCWYQVGLHAINTFLQTSICLLGPWQAILLTLSFSQNRRGTKMVDD